MTKQSFISTYKYQLRRSIVLTIASLAVAIATMLLMTVIMNYCIDGSFSLEGFSIVGLDAMGGLCIFLYAIILCSEFLNTGAANGVSRTTTVAAAAASLFTSSAACSAFISVITPLINLIISGESGSFHFLEFCYGRKSFYMLYGENPIVCEIRYFVMCTFLLFLFSAFGFAFSSVYYKISKRAAVILSVVLAAFVFFGYPVGYMILSKRGIDLEEKLSALFNSWKRLMGMAYVNGSQAGSCVQGALMMLLFSAAFLFIAWLFARRSNVKPAPIRGE